MSSLIAARNLLVSKGFTGLLSTLDAAFDPSDAPAGGNIYGNPNVNALSDDIVFGNSGANTLIGGKGNDILDGGAGADNLVGGEGIDWASYASAAKGVTASLAGPSWWNTGDAKGDTYSGIENLMGSGFADNLSGDSADNVISGLNGNDSLSGGIGGNDTLNGDAGNDSLYAGSGHDTLNGGADNDMLYGEGGDTLNGDGGDDILMAGARADVMNGGDGNDQFFGAYQPVAADAGTWTMNGGNGSDFFKAGFGSESFNGGSNVGGFDEVSYDNATSGVTVNLATGVGSGGAAGDSYSGIEWAKGSVFDDTLIGSSRQDVLEGGLGNDHLFGGGSNDSFVFDVTPHQNSIEGTYFGPMIKANIGNDVIEDYDVQASAGDQSFDGVYFEGITQAQFSQIHADQVGANTVLTSDLFDGSITLLNTDAAFWHQI